MIGALAALEMVLGDLGLDVEPGRAVTAAQQVLIGQQEPPWSELGCGDRADVSKSSDRRMTDWMAHRIAFW